MRIAKKSRSEPRSAGELLVCARIIGEVDKGWSKVSVRQKSMDLVKLGRKELNIDM